jgi:YggT family protein
MQNFLLVVVDKLFFIVEAAIIGRALLSWFPIGPGNPFYPLALILHQVTEPILAPARRIIPTIGMFDISPIIVLLILQFVHGQVLRAIEMAGRSAGY